MVGREVLPMKSGQDACTLRASDVRLENTKGATERIVLPDPTHSQSTHTHLDSQGIDSGADPEEGAFLSMFYT